MDVPRTLVAHAAPKAIEETGPFNGVHLNGGTVLTMADRDCHDQMSRFMQGGPLAIVQAASPPVSIGPAGLGFRSPATGDVLHVDGAGVEQLRTLWRSRSFR